MLSGPATAAPKTILVFGDSLSAGYGLAIEESWVTLLGQDLKRIRPGYRIVNASISGETTLGGRQRIAQALRQYQPSIVILELGANDGLRGSSTTDIEANLASLVRQCQQSNGKVLLVGMRLPPNYGEPYITRFRNLYPRLAQRYHVALVPFMLEGVSNEQFQADNLHPTAAAQPQVKDNILRALKPLLR